MDTKEIIKDFPILDREIGGHKLVYLDNAATSQKPRAVIDAISHYYEHYNANVHRGIHTMSEEATAAYEEVREKIAAFIGADNTCEIIYTRNTTEAINLVAYSWGRQNVLPGDEIVLTPMEHHSNLVPWQQLAAEREAKLVFLELTEDGQVNMESARSLIGPKTRLVALTAMSNVLGTIVPVREIADIAHAAGAVVLVDGAQSVPHLPTSVKEMGCDFLAFSFHKMLGPTGTGILWGKKELLEAMPPFMFGGDMISSVAREKSRFNELPWKFEAGTPNIADVIASGAAIDYLSKLGMENVRRHEVEITRYALEKLGSLKDIVIYGPKDAEKRGGVIAFNIDGLHPHDLGQILSDSGIAIRAGHHCCQPLMKDLKVMGTARASFYIYNTTAEVDLLAAALEEADKVLGHVAVR
ncbi:MAG: cysteine desulfurase [Cyanobacteria bacterium SZAS LIN-2]|nr:cysteine desulfurase [Cyanobacteria bacterium SZAS LIN-3]MBS1998712.1 cysteine desulfurase [Cyanobacteria bacterium SZAS LIN-2]